MPYEFEKLFIGQSPEDPYLRVAQRNFDREFTNFEEDKEAAIYRISESLGEAVFLLAEKAQGRKTFEESAPYRLNAIIGDLAISRTRLANISRINLGRLLADSEERPMTINQAIMPLARARGALDIRAQAIKGERALTPQIKGLMREVVIPKIHLADSGIRAKSYKSYELRGYHYRQLRQLYINLSGN